MVVSFDSFLIVFHALRLMVRVILVDMMTSSIFSSFLLHSDNQFIIVLYDIFL